MKLASVGALYEARCVKLASIGGVHGQLMSCVSVAADIEGGLREGYFTLNADLRSVHSVGVKL